MRIAFLLSLTLASIFAFVGCPKPTPTAPTVISTNPQNDSVDMPTNITIDATFSEMMDSAFINTSTFTLTKVAGEGGSGPVTGTVSLSGQVASFKPTSNLDPGSKYIATITNGAKDQRGTSLPSNFMWTFSTVASAVPPQAVEQSQPAVPSPAAKAPPATKPTVEPTETEEYGPAPRIRNRAPDFYPSSYPRAHRPPPPMPVYVQPRIPRVGADYIWTPGYWAWDASFDDYYWVPGTWVRAPRPGVYWTPGYWALINGVYLWERGYWGPTVGFYGRINYGFGYNGSGYTGGQWQGTRFTYNNSVNNITTTNITNVTNVTNVTTINSYSTAAPTTHTEIQSQTIRQQLAAGKAPQGVQAAEKTQTTQEQTARTVPTLRASQNLGKPPVAATTQPVATPTDLTKGPGNIPATKASGTYTPAPKVEPRPATPERRPAPMQPTAPAPQVSPTQKTTPEPKSVRERKGPQGRRAAPETTAAPVQKTAPERKAPSAPSTPAFQKGVPEEEPKAAPARKNAPVQGIAPIQKATPERKAPPEHKAPQERKAEPTHEAAPTEKVAPKPETAPKEKISPEGKAAKAKKAEPARKQSEQDKDASKRKQARPKKDRKETESEAQ